MARMMKLMTMAMVLTKVAAITPPRVLLERFIPLVILNFDAAARAAGWRGENRCE